MTPPTPALRRLRSPSANPVCDVHQSLTPPPISLKKFLLVARLKCNSSCNKKKSECCCFFERFTHIYAGFQDQSYMLDHKPIIYAGSQDQSYKQDHRINRICKITGSTVNQNHRINRIFEITGSTVNQDHRINRKPRPQDQS